MVKSTFLALALGAAVSVSARRGLCHRYPTKLAKIQACPTATQFCKDYLAPAGPTFTKTIKTTETVKAADKTDTETSTETETTTTNVVTEEASTTTITGDSTSTVTTSKFSCGAQAARNVKRKEAIAATKTADCGIVTTSATDAISGACNCFLASSTTKTKTVTSGSQSTTTTTEIVTTTTSIEATTTTTPTKTETATQTQCVAIPTFKLQIDCHGCSDDGNYVKQGAYTFDDVVTTKNASDATVFYIDQGTKWLRSVNDNSIVAAEKDITSSLYVCGDAGCGGFGQQTDPPACKAPSQGLGSHEQLTCTQSGGNNFVVLTFGYSQLAMSHSENDWGGYGHPTQLYFVAA